MTPIEAVKALYEMLDEDGPTERVGRRLICRACITDLAQAYHAPDCPWLQMPAVVKALEVAERLADARRGTVRRGDDGVSNDH